MRNSHRFEINDIIKQQDSFWTRYRETTREIYAGRKFTESNGFRLVVSKRLH